MSIVVKAGQVLLKVPTFFSNSPPFALDAVRRFAIVPDGCTVPALGRGNAPPRSILHPSDENQLFGDTRQKLRFALK